jgi:hypothetical protein
MRPLAPLVDAQRHCEAEISFFGRQPPRFLYHYTSAAGLHGILESGVIRGSNFAFMNDRSEFTYGATLLHRLIRERLNRAVVGAVHRFYEIAIEPDNAGALDLYLACFCEEGDLLSQWRGYGNASSRYCMEFATEELKALNTTIPPIQPVIYETTPQMHLLTHIIDEHARAAIALKTAAAEFDTVALEVVRSLYRCSAPAIAILKDATFSEEREWRSFQFLASDGDLSNLVFRLSEGQMKPSIPLLGGGNPGKLPLRRVIAGASRAPEQAVKAAHLMLARYGYRDVPVELSRVPLSG